MILNGFLNATDSLFIYKYLKKLIFNSLHEILRKEINQFNPDKKDEI